MRIAPGAFALLAAACTIWNGVTLPGGAYAEEVEAAGPIAHWRFDAIDAEAGGPRIVRDLSGRGHDCTASIGVRSEEGPAPGTSAARIGTNDEIDCSANAAFAFAADAAFTFEAFVLFEPDKPRGESEFRTLFDRMAGTSPGARHGYFAFLTRPSGSDEWTLALERWSAGTRQTGVFTTSTAELVPGKWIHYAITQEQSGRLALYVNGTLRHESLVVPPAAAPPESVDLILGRNQTASCCALVGKLAEMAIYDHALDAVTLERHYRAGRPNQ